MNTGKRKLGNRIISVFLALLLLFTMIPANALSVAAMSGEPSSVGDESATTAEETTEKTDETTTEGEKTPEESTTAEESTTKETESEPQPEDNHLKIVVKDTLGSPISGASVRIGSEVITTDGNGVADFGEKEDGSYSVVVSKEGYIETIESITNGDVHRFEIILSSDTAEASDVEMKGTVTADGVVNNDAVASVTVYDLTNSTSEELALDSAGAFSAFLTVGARYKITVTPKNEKAFAPVSKEFTATESIASEYTSYNLISEKYTVTLNGKTVGQYKYGEKCTADIGRAGYTVEAGSVDVTENGTKISYDRDGDTVSFNVTGDTVITASYTYTASFKIDGKGDIVIDDEKKKENIDITKNDGETVRYTINADAGYYIKSLTVDGDAVSVPGEKTTYSGTVNKNSQISVVFGEIQYKVTIAISNSAEKKGSASVSVDAAELVSVNDSGEDGSNSKVYTVGIKNFADNKHTLTLKTQVKDKYVLEYSVGGAQRKEVQNNEIVLGNIKEDTTVNLYVVPVAYTLTYVDPLASESVTEVEFTVESGEFTLPSPNKKGYTFIGWSEAVPDGFTKDTKGLLNGKYDYEKFSGDTTLYAVYTINAADAKAKSVVTYLNKAEDKAVEYSYSTDSDKKVTDEISDAWFGNDVTVELTTLEGVELTAVGTDEGKEPITYTVDENNRFVLKTVDGECVSTAVEISGSITHKCTVAETEVAIEYAAEKSAFTVKRDAVAPDFEVKNNTQTNADEMKASDKDSGLKAVEYAVISTNAPLYKDILEKVENKDFGYVESLKEKLRAETWNEITADEDSVYRHSYTLTDDIYVVYRAVDEAGNDVYSSFDLTVPKIDSVKYTYTDNAGSHEVSEGSIYTSGNVTFEVTVSDRRLFYIDKSNENYTYNGCKLVIYERGNSTNDIVLDDTTAVEKWSPFKDKWVATFTVDKDSEAFKNLLDKELTFAVTAEDQAGNKAVSYTDSAKIVFVETKAPEITVDYQYANGEQKLNAACAAGEKLFSSDDVVACIEVGKDNFDPYANGDSAASVVVKVDGKVAGDVSWTKTSEKWTAEVPVADEGEHVVTVEATSQAGTAASYTSGSIVIDKTAPEIKIEYSNTQNDVYSDGESLFNNGNKDTLTATITVSDNYLRPVTGEAQKTKAVVKVGDTQQEVTWTETDTEWTTSVELTKEEGAYTLTVEAADQAGNGKTESSTFCNDNTAPEVTGVSLSYAQGNKILNILTFGIFFNDVVKVTVSAKDGSEAYCSGLKTIELLFNDKADNMTADVFTAGEDESLVAEFTIPQETLEGLPNNWENNLGVRVTDQVGNKNELKINEVDENDGIDTDSVLYETNKPTSSISFEKYVAEGREWLMINESVKISVTDIAEGELCSGIDEVRITVTGGGKTVELASDDFSGNETIENSHEYTFDYESFAAGKNEITVVVIDNAGNENEEPAYTVYKDVEAPDITCDTANADVFYNGAGKLWVMKGESIKIDVKDAAIDGDTDKEFTSGLKEASAKVGDTVVSTLTADGTLVVEYDALAKGENIITVNTVDNSGNTNSATYTVYKDVDAPTITCDTESTDVFYHEESKLWVMKGESIKIDVKEVVIDGDTEMQYTSGLKEASVSVGATEVDNLTADGTLVVEYGDLAEGQNTITVNTVDNSGNTNSAEYTVYKDITVPVFTYDTTDEKVFYHDNRVQENPKLWLMKEKDISIDVKDAVFADDTENTRTSGLKIAKVTVSQPEGTVSREYISTTGEFTVKYADLTPGENTVTIYACDNSGYEITQTITVYKDVYEPTIDAISIEPSENADSPVRKILNKLTFGIFFNAKVKVMLECNDAEPSAGIKQVALLYNDGKDTITGKYEGSVYVFELPDDKSADQWTAELSASAVDHVGNTCATTPIKDIKTGDLDDIYSDTVLYEKKAPTITYDYADYAKDTDNNSLYFDTATKTYWMIKDGTIDIAVDDNKNNEIDKKFVSGLNNVTVKISGTVDGEKAEKDLVTESYSDSYTVNKTYTVSYDDLYEGKNVITVRAEDNSCNISETITDNSAKETTIVIYKDSKDPTINGVKIYRAEQVNGENRIITRRSYGNFYNGAVRIAVSLLDEKFSSGIESLSLKYVYTDENGKKGTIDGVMETKADDKAEAKKGGKKEAENEDKVLNAADTKEDVTAEYTFMLEPLTKKDKDGNDVLVDTEGYLVITVVDNTGNSYTFDNNTGKEDDAWPLDTDGDDAKSNILVNSLMFENNKVTFEAALSDATYSCDNRDNETDNHLWYKNTDVNYTVTVRDTLDRDSGLLNSGLKSVKIVVKNANGETTAVDVNLGNSKDDKEPVYEETYDFNLKDNGGAEGQNIITVTSVDNSNNSSSHSVTLYVDETRPVVDFFSFKGVNGNQELTYDKCKTVTKTDYGYFFSKDTEVTVYVSDKCPSSGISKVYFVAIPAENAKPSTSMDTAQSLVTECCVKGTENGGIYSASATFKVKANFKGQIYAYVEDNVGYTSLDMSKTGYDQWVRPDGLIVETQAMHNQMSEHIKIEILSTPVTYLNGSKNPLFAGDVKLRLSVDDSYSGIREVTYNVVAGHDTGKNFTETLVTKNGTRGWTSESDINLTTFLSKEITVSNNSNDIKIYLSMVDNSGNVTTNENDPLVISIDKDAPEVSVSFTPDDSGDDAEFTGFFKTDRTMTVKVKERNFSKDLVKITATADERPYAIAPGFDKGVEVVENGIQYFIYTMTYVFHNDADYTFAIAASDKAENKTADEQVNYGSAAAKTVAKKFTVDQTLPEITVNISGQKGKDIYYKGDVTVEVTVVEHNYEEGRYNAVFTMRNPQSGVPEKVSMPTPSISGGGDVWHHTYVFTMEYMSNLESIKVVDMAGNEKDTYNGNYAGEDFVVDKTDPTIQFFTNSDMQNKLDRTATKSKTVTPYIVIKDTNLDVYDEGDYDIQLKGNYNGPGLSGKEDYTFSYIRDPFDPTVLTIGFNNFANKEDVDDIYTFTITAVDKAGCVTTESVVFSVNRYGSTFMVSEDTEVLLSKYYTNSPQDISIVQINAAEINDQRVSVTKNGIASDLTQGEDYTVTNKAPGTKATTGEKNTDSNWYESTYIINKDNFNDEGIYSVTVYSKDTAKSVLTSATSKRTMYLFKDTQRSDKAVLVDEKALEAPVNFQIDKTVPTASIVDIEDGKQYFTGSKEFTVYADDSVSLKDAVISIDGESQTYSAEEIKAGVTQVIQKDDAGKFQTIKVEAHDTAGNVYTSEASIQVTTNIPAWFAENEIAQITVAIVALMLIIFIIIIMKRRKSRDK